MSSSERTDFGCIMADIDHFKSFNDRFGHAMGDWVLTKVSHCVKEQTRAVDVFGRLGGEEFVVILPQCTSEDAKKFIEQKKIAGSQGKPFRRATFTLSEAAIEQLQELAIDTQLAKSHIIRILIDELCNKDQKEKLRK